MSEKVIVNKVGTALIWLVIRLKAFDVVVEKKYLLARRWALGLLWRLSSASQLFSFVHMCVCDGSVWSVCAGVDTSRCLHFYTRVVWVIVERERWRQGGSSALQYSPQLQCKMWIEVTLSTAGVGTLKDPASFTQWYVYSLPMST